MLTGCDLGAIIAQGPAPVRRGGVGRILRHRAYWWWAGTNLDRPHHSALQGGPSPRTFPKVQFQGPKAPGALCPAIFCEGGVGAPEAHDAKVLVNTGPGILVFNRFRGHSAVRSSRAPQSGLPTNPG